MEPVAATSYVLHSLFSGLWAGSVLFVVLTVLPMAREGELNAAPLQSATGTLTWVSRMSALVLLLTGSQMAAARYTSDSLVGTTGGSLILGLFAPWVVLAIAVEVGTSRLRDGTERDRCHGRREIADDGVPNVAFLALGETDERCRGARPTHGVSQWRWPDRAGGVELAPDRSCRCGGVASVPDVDS